MPRTAGIGTLVLRMPLEDRGKFFRAAFKSITLDGHGRGTWRKQSLKNYELSDAPYTFILRHASGYMAQSRIRDGVTLSRTVRLK